nr:hypothetical protein [uncultured Flavonifractor sp.]
MNEEIKNLIAAADKAIKEERFDDLMEFYTEDAVLVVKPGSEAKGKAAIKDAFLKIAACVSGHGEGTHPFHLYIY